MRKKRQSGFTLVELMLVVGVIGILAAVAFPAYQDYTIRSRIAEAFGLAGPVQKAVRDYYDRWGVFPEGNAQAGLQAPERYVGNYIRSIRVERGAIAITLGNVGKDFDGRELHLLPAVNSAAPTAPFAWVCEKGPAPEGMTPIVEIPAERLTLLPRYVPAPCRPRS
jgi:type IV pilus assembly protein PilA